MRKIIFGGILSVMLVACGGNSGGVSKAGPVNIDGFTAIAIDGSDAEILMKRDGAGKMLEQGVIRNGIKEGAWMVYHENESIKTLSSYIDGNLNGPYMEFNNRGQVEKKIEYINNEFHGVYGEYKYGRPIKELTYNFGVLEGPFREWNDRGKLTKKGGFLKGEQHGVLQFFDEDEKIIMEYTYENGEKISGGMVEK